MIKAFKGGNALWIIIVIISLLCASGLLFFMLQERAKRIETEEQLSKTKKAKRTAEVKLDHVRLELIQFKDKTKLLEGRLEEEKENYRTTLTKIEKKDSQIKELEGTLTNEKKQRIDLANTLAQLREDYGNLKEELKGAKKRVGQLKDRVGKSIDRVGVELKKIVVKPKRELSGKILVVNREFHFVVVDLGKKDNVSIGDEFSVYRDSRELGRVRIEKTYEAMSTATILPGSQEFDIGEDCIVRSF